MTVTNLTRRQPLISYCVNNVDDAARALLRAHACEAAEEHCLQRCGACYEGPFLLLDGQFFSGPSHRAILDALTAEGPAPPGEKVAGENVERCWKVKEAGA